MSFGKFLKKAGRQIEKFAAGNGKAGRLFPLAKVLRPVRHKIGLTGRNWKKARSHFMPIGNNSAMSVYASGGSGGYVGSTGFRRMV